MGHGGPLSTGYGAGWGLAAVAGAFALVVALPALFRDAPEGLEVAATGLGLTPFILLLLLACWLVRRDGVLIGCAATAFAVALVTVVQGGAPLFLTLGILLLAVAAVRARRQVRSAVSDGGSATKVEP